MWSVSVWLFEENNYRLIYLAINKLIINKVLIAGIFSQKENIDILQLGQINILRWATLVLALVCYQRVDLKDLLVKFKLPSRQRLTRERRDKVGFKPCNKSRCPVCEQIGNNTVEEVVISTTGAKMRIKDKLTFKSKKNF